MIAYIKQLDAYVKPTETLYIGVDGVAPMAKIKQQRARRFKSAQTAEEEGRIRAEAQGIKYTPQPRWDTNAITPGTQFMAALATALRTYAKTAPKKIIVSPADEAGEGEQKIMAWVRAKKPSDIVVYGLDADLIVLSLWTSATESVNVDLFREEVEFSGGVKEDALGEEQFLYMNVNHLSMTLYEHFGNKSQDKSVFVRDFVGLMSLLGNDFVPHGMTLKIKDEGIEKLLEIYKTLDAQLVESTPSGWCYTITTLTKILKTVAADEDRAIHRAVEKKLKARVGSTGSKEAVDQALARYNDQPVLWAAEKPLIQYVQLPDREFSSMVLRSDWRATYDKLALWDADPNIAAKMFLESLGWTLAYYSGASIDMTWYYPWPLPPRIETVAQFCETLTEIPIPSTARPVLKPLEQLAMVLPESSSIFCLRNMRCYQKVSVCLANTLGCI